MKFETVSSILKNDPQATTLSRLLPDGMSRQCVLQIEAEDSFETVLTTLRLHAEPVVLHVSEQSQAFDDPIRFALLWQVRTPYDVSFAFPRSRVVSLGRHAYQCGFPFASSLKKASQILYIYEVKQKEAGQRTEMLSAKQGENQQVNDATVVIRERQETSIQRISDAPSHNKRRGFVYIAQEGKAEHVYEIGEGGLRVGRDPGMDIFLAEKTVGRFHATLLPLGGGTYGLRDEGSKNSTHCINFGILTPHRIYPLRSGDVIRVGQTLLTFTTKEQTELEPFS